MSDHEAPTIHVISPKNPISNWLGKEETFSNADSITFDTD